MSSMPMDYTRYSNQAKVEKAPVTVKEVPVTVREISVVDEVIAPEEAIEVETLNVPNEAVYGIVENCKMLNVRQSANIKAPIISVIPAGTVVHIIEEDSTDEFYGVHVENDSVDFDGFCMKKFVRPV